MSLKVDHHAIRGTSHTIETRFIHSLTLYNPSTAEYSAAKYGDPRVPSVLAVRQTVLLSGVKPTIGPVPRYTQNMDKWSTQIIAILLTTSSIQ